MNGKFKYFHIQTFHTYPKHKFTLNKLEITLYGYDSITAGPQANIGIRAFREAGEQGGQMGSNDRDLHAAGRA